MVFALLLSAIIWNVGTWYLGLPASSSHTLIGSIVGVGLMNSLISSSQQFGEGVNWGKVQDTAMALLISPVVGFVAAGLLLLAAKVVIRNPALYKSPEGKTPPPLWIRGLLVLTCTGVSFAHGSNDGQKGMGLIMLILIGIVPATYALEPRDRRPTALQSIVAASQAAAPVLGKAPDASDALANAVADAELSRFLTTGKPTDQTMTSLARQERRRRRRRSASVKSIGELHGRAALARAARRLSGRGRHHQARQGRRDHRRQGQGHAAASCAASSPTLTDFIPLWVKIAVAVALGLGTTIGWKRIVVTVGEKIGKSHLTYAQGASAELVAMLTIGAADMLRPAGQHDAHPVVRHRRHDGGQPLGPAEGDAAQHPAGLGAHPAGLHDPRLGRCSPPACSSSCGCSDLVALSTGSA